MAVILLTTEAAQRRGIKRLLKVDPATAVKLWWAKHDGTTTDPVLKAKLDDIEQVYLGNEQVPGSYKVERGMEPPEQEELWFNK